jgi:hypothetical protein
VVGLTIDGDLLADEGASDLMLSNVRILGNLVSLGSGTTLLGSEFHGDVRLAGQATVVNSVFVALSTTDSPMDTCIDSHIFDDANNDSQVTLDEIGVSICE